MMYYYNGFFPFHMFGFVFMIIFWAVIIFGVVVLFKRLSHHHKGDHKAMDILKERYAKGEITKEQFETMKRELTKGE